MDRTCELRNNKVKMGVALLTIPLMAHYSLIFHILAPANCTGLRILVLKEEYLHQETQQHLKPHNKADNRITILVAGLSWFKKEESLLHNVNIK